MYNFYHGEEELKYLQPWLLNIQARAPSSPVLIVGTHLDSFSLSQEDVDKKRIQMRTKIKDMLRNPGFPNDVSFTELDCYNEKQINEVKSKVKALIDRYVLIDMLKNLFAKVKGLHGLLNAQISKRLFVIVLLSSAKIRGQKIMGGLVPSSYIVSI